MRSWITNTAAAGAIIVLLAVALAGVLGAEPTPEDRAHALEQRLRCPVCKSVSIAESPSATAASMRVVVAEQVAAGRSDEQIIDYFQDRYGRWVLLDPPMTGDTRWLWLLSLSAAGVGVGVLLLRRGTRSPSAAALTDAEREQLVAAMSHYELHHAQDDEP